MHPGLTLSANRAEEVRNHLGPALTGQNRAENRALTGQNLADGLILNANFAEKRAEEVRNHHGPALTGQKPIEHLRS